MTAYASLSSLLAPPTQAQLLTQILSLLELGGFPATAWQSGSAGPVFANTEAAVVASLGQALANIAAGGQLPLPGQPNTGATGAWLDLLGTQVFQSPRNPATFTKGSVLLADAANAGPFSINPGALSCEDATRTYIYQSTNGAVLTLPLGGTLVVPVQAAAAGAGYNLANSAISILLTSLAGVTVSNPALGSTGTWITQAGTNAETDALYAQRLASKWSTLGSGSNTGAYYYTATTPSLTGTTEVVQCAVFATGGAVTVVIAGAAGPVSTSAYNLVNAALQAKRPLTVQVSLVNATPSNTVFAGNVFVSGAYDPIATLAAVQIAVGSLSAPVGIGGTLYLDQVLEAILAVPGVYSVGPTSSSPTGLLAAPVANLTLGASTVLAPIFTLTSTH